VDLTVGWRRASGRRRFRVVLGTICVLSFAAGLTTAVAGVGRPGSPALAPHTAPVPAATVNRNRAAAWTAQQVSPAVAVSCDPAMCAQLRKTGFPAARLMALRPAAAHPPRSGVIIATPAIRRQFGTSLAAAYAPLVLASFGTGAGRVDVRAVAAAGAAAARSRLRSGQASRRSAGSDLAGNQNIQASPAARAALLAGHVDARLLATLSVLASAMPVRLIRFDGLPPGASPAVPLRGAQIGAATPAARSAILALLRAQQSPYRPAVAAVTRGPSGQPLVTVRFDVVDLLAAGSPA
jgi:hypothetical protein